MFTGIIEELGAVESIQSRAAGARLKIHCKKVLEDMTEGASIAVNGVCLTAVELRAESFSADLAPETLRAATWARCARFRASIWNGLLSPDTPPQRAHRTGPRGCHRRVSYRWKRWATITGG
jgi:hypothetical protein